MASPDSYVQLGAGTFAAVLIDGVVYAVENLTAAHVENIMKLDGGEKRIYDTIERLHTIAERCLEMRQVLLDATGQKRR